MLKTLLLLVSVFYTVILIVVSLINLNSVPSLGSSFDDKLYHLVAYFILGFLWMTYVKIGLLKKKTLQVTLILLVFGIVLELIQHQINPNRTFDALDMAANCIGVILGILIASIINIYKLNIFKALLN